MKPAIRYAPNKASMTSTRFKSSITYFSPTKVIATMAGNVKGNFSIVERTTQISPNEVAEGGMNH